MRELKRKSINYKKGRYERMLGFKSSHNSSKQIPVKFLAHEDIDEAYTSENVNISIFGLSGYGGTFAAQILALRMQQQHIPTYILAPGTGKPDYLGICKNAGGAVVTLGYGAETHINVMEVRAPFSSDANRTGIHSTLHTKVTALQAFFNIVVGDTGLNKEESTLVKSYLYQLYEDFGIVEDDTSLYIPGTKVYKDMPILGNFYNKIKECDELSRLTKKLELYVCGSMNFLNHQTDIDITNKFFLFDLGELHEKLSILQDTRSVCLFAAYEVITGLIKENSEKQKMLFIDEPWTFITHNISEANYFEQTFIDGKKYNFGTLFATKEISDFFSMGDGTLGERLVDGCDAKMCFHLSELFSNELMDRDKQFLGEEELDTLKVAKRGVCLLRTRAKRELITIDATEKEKDIVDWAFRAACEMSKKG